MTFCHLYNALCESGNDLIKVGQFFWAGQRGDAHFLPLGNETGLGLICSLS